MTLSKNLLVCCLLLFCGCISLADVFVEDIGETETIEIDDQRPQNNFDVSPSKTVDELLMRQKRATTDYSSTEYDETEDDDDTGGSGNDANYEDEDDDQYYDENGDKKETGDRKKDTDQVSPPVVVAVPETTPILPTRVVPNLMSPKFEIDMSGQISPPTSSSDGELIASSATSPEPPVIYSSIAYPDIPEGSGNEDYSEASSIVPTQPLDISGQTRLPEFSSVYPSYFDPNNRESPVLVTERPPNQPPYVKTKLRKYPITAGKSFRLRIPEETFIDLEDGNTRKLNLKLKYENGSIVRNSWIGFDADNQMVYALPVDENGIGRYIFKLEAYDKEGLSASETLEIVVRQYSGSRLISHQFKIEFNFVDTSPAVVVNWPWKFLEKIAELYGDPKLGNIIILEVNTNPFIFGWTNDTLTQPSCPKEVIRSLFSRLIDETAKSSKSLTGGPSRRLKSLLGPEIAVKSVTLTYHGTCMHDASLSPSDPNVVGKDAAVPVIRNPIDRINVTAGELLRFKVPEDTCWDAQDGATPKLNLQLLTTNRRELSPNAWLQFDTKNQEFVGVPLEEEVGREEYQLVCSDHSGLMAVDGIVVHVQTRPFTESFGVDFGLEFRDFSGHRRDLKVKIMEAISSYFGDGTALNVILKTFDVDEARVTWHNKSLDHLPCDHPHLKWVASQMLLPDGKIRPRFVQHFEPYLQLVDVTAIKKDICAVNASPVPTSGGPRDGGSGGSSGGHETTIFHGIIPSSDYLLTFIIPAVIITFMLLLAILLACILHKKRRAGKLNLFYSESLPPRVPVILQDELYEDQEQGFHKQPILLPEDARPSGGGGHFNPHEMDRLLAQQQTVNIDFARAGSLSRPTPAYQRRQL